MRSIVALLVIGLAATGCEGWSGTRTQDTTDVIVVSADRIPAPEAARAWDIEYRSTSVSGTATTVTGWVAIPEVDGTIPILAWAHPTAGLADECAPSAAGGRTPYHFEPELSAGWAVVATDYEGLGGPGLHPYLVSESEARSIFDIARAARELDGRVGTDLLLWGFSQGGHAVLSAAAFADTLGPEFDVAGTVAVAPAVDLDGWPPVAIGTFQQGYIATIVAAYADTYGLDPADVLSPDAIGLLDEVRTSCSDPTSHAIARLDDAFVADPSRLEPWAGLLEENSPERRPIDSPVLLVVGDDDELWPVELIPVVTETMCAAGTPLATAIVIGAGHLAVNGAARGQINGFLSDRLAGVPFESEC